MNDVECLDEVSHNFEEAFKDHQKSVVATSYDDLKRLKLINKNNVNGFENDTILKGKTNYVPYNEKIVEQEVALLKDPVSWLRYLSVGLLLRLRQLISKKADGAKTYDRVIAVGELLLGGYYSSLHRREDIKEYAALNVHSIPIYTSYGNIALRYANILYPDMTFYPGQRHFVDFTFPWLAVRDKDNALLFSPGIGFGQFSGAERRIYTDLKLELSYQYQAFPIFSCGLGADLGYRWVQELKINPLVFRGYIRLTLFDKLVIDAGYRVMDHGPNRKDALPVFVRVSVKDIVSTAYWIGRLL